MIANPLLKDILIVIKGAGDLASGVAYRLKRSGFPLIMTELPAPVFVRRTVAFGEAVYNGETSVEGLTARRVDTPDEAHRLAGSDTIPILVDPAATVVTQLKPQVVVDAIMAKVNTGTTIGDAPLVIALGPGFTAGQNCHAIVETNRGHSLGRVIYTGQAELNTKTPGLVKGYAADRVLRAPVEGYVAGRVAIGQLIKQNELIATVNSNEIRAPFDGVLRGLIHPNVPVTAGLKVGDLDPRGKIEHCYSISDKSLAMGGGVLEAVMASEVVRKSFSPYSQT